MLHVPAVVVVLDARKRDERRLRCVVGLGAWSSRRVCSFCARSFHMFVLYSFFLLFLGSLLPFCLLSAIRVSHVRRMVTPVAHSPRCLSRSRWVWVYH